MAGPGRLGTATGRRTQRRTNNPVDPRAMAPQLVSGDTDPPQTNFAVKTFHRQMLVLDTGNPGTFAAMTAGDIGTSLPGGTTAWASLRIVKVSLWGSANETASPNFIGNYVTVQAPGDGSFLDSNTQTFEDFGTQGSVRPQIHYLPSFIQRARWYSTTSTDVVLRAATATGSATVSGQILFIITVELQSRLEGPVDFMSRLQSLTLSKPLNDLVKDGEKPSASAESPDVPDANSC